MKNKTLPLLFFFAFLLSSCGENEDVPLTKQYPGHWRSTFDLGITKTLASHKIRGCGEYKYKENAKKNKQYVVRCTRDGTNWRTYFVQTRSNEVTGPHITDPSLN